MPVNLQTGKEMDEISTAFIKWTCAVIPGDEGGVRIVLDPPIFASHGVSREMELEMKATVDMIFSMIQIYAEKQGILADGGKLESADLCVKDSPAVFAEMLINKMKHEVMSWDQVREYLIEKLTNKTFTNGADNE